MGNISQKDLQRGIEATKVTAETHRRLGWSFSPPAFACEQIRTAYKQAYCSL